MQCSRVWGPPELQPTMFRDSDSARDLPQGLAPAEHVPCLGPPPQRRSALFGCMCFLEDGRCTSCFSTAGSCSAPGPGKGLLLGAWQGSRWGPEAELLGTTRMARLATRGFLHGQSNCEEPIYPGWTRPSCSELLNCFLKACLSLPHRRQTQRQAPPGRAPRGPTHVWEMHKGEDQGVQD